MGAESRLKSHKWGREREEMDETVNTQKEVPSIEFFHVPFPSHRKCCHSLEMKLKMCQADLGLALLLCFGYN